MFHALRHYNNMRNNPMSDAAQRATLVLERDPEEGHWFLVAYLVHDSGHRERKTVTRHATRDEAAAALEATWREAFGRKLAHAA